jgi:hypothetical protein
MYDLFFPSDHIPAGMNTTEVHETFTTGGYYSYKIPNTDPPLYFLGFNSMYYKNGIECYEEAYNTGSN